VLLSARLSVAYCLLVGWPVATCMNLHNSVEKAPMRKMYNEFVRLHVQCWLLILTRFHFRRVVRNQMQDDQGWLLLVVWSTNCQTVRRIGSEWSVVVYVQCEDVNLIQFCSKRNE
jgi:hypothetical protein